MSSQTIPSVKSILAAIDVDAACQMLDVKPRSIRRAQEFKYFPADWFPVIRKLCERKGIDCPEVLFNWRVHTTADGNAHERSQA